MWLLLCLAAIGCIVLGMGVPVTATYIILVVLVAPALIPFGVPSMAAHMFIFYFGTMSFLTPPVCLSVFVACSIAKSKIGGTAISALRLAILGYLLPFAFVYNSAYLGYGSWLQICEAIVSGIVGVMLLALGLIGFWRCVIPMWARLLCCGVGIVVLLLNHVNFYILPIAFIVLFAMIFVWRGNENSTSTAIA